VKRAEPSNAVDYWLREGGAGVGFDVGDAKVAGGDPLAVLLEQDAVFGNLGQAARVMQSSFG